MKYTKGKIWLGLAALAAVAAVMVWWLQGSPAPQADQGRAVAVAQGEMRRLVVSTGTVKPQVGAEVKVGARISGLVDKLLVAVGQPVKAGEVVAVIEHRGLEAKLAQAVAQAQAAQGRLKRLQATAPRELAQARAELAEVQAGLDQARLEHGRQIKLRQKAAVSSQEMERARREMRVLQARLTAAQARLNRTKAALPGDIAVAASELAAAQASVQTAEINLDYATVRAPISGVVSSISTQEGETVSASLNSPTFITIIDLGRLQVDDYVDETDVGLIKPGQEATFTVDAFPDQPFKGKVAAVHPSAQLIDNVVYYTAVISIEGDYRHKLKPEMTATASIVVDRKPDALWVPTAAVRIKKGKHLVRLPGNPKPQEVKVGWSSQGRTEIIAGLKPGQKVLVKAKR